MFEFPDKSSKSTQKSPEQNGSLLLVQIFDKGKEVFFLSKKCSINDGALHGAENGAKPPNVVIAEVT